MIEMNCIGILNMLGFNYRGFIFGYSDYMREIFINRVIVYMGIDYV